MRRSFGNAIGISAATHAAIFAIALVITARLPDPTADIAANKVSRGIVWIPQSGPRKGGGGGGDRRPDPPRNAESRGNDRVTLPSQKPALQASKPAEVTPPEQHIDVAALPSVSGLTEIPGIISVVPNPGTLLGPGTDGGVGTGRDRGNGAGDGGGLDRGRGGDTGGDVYQPGTNGVTYPRLIREVPGRYTAAALRARVEGFIELRAVVLPNGSVGDVWITRSLDPVFGLDDEAVRTVKEWRFQPGTRDGKPVAVVVPIELRFTIR